MEFTDEPDIGLEQAGTDHVSAWIFKLEMTVLFVVFAMFDRYQFFPHFPERPQPHLKWVYSPRP